MKESHCTYERVVLHIWTNCITHMKDSHNTYERVLARWLLHVTHVIGYEAMHTRTHVHTHTHTQTHTNTRKHTQTHTHTHFGHEAMRRGPCEEPGDTFVDEPCHTCKWVMSHLNESCRTCKWDVSHICFGMNAVCCSVLKCVAVCYSMLQCAAVYGRVLHSVHGGFALSRKSHELKGSFAENDH